MIRRVLRLLLAAVLMTSGVAVAFVPASAATDSPVTASGTGDFASLKVTVSQTTNLINQTVHVNWSGGQATGPEGNFKTNYLQIMQCWGDDDAGPTREQCQYGALGAQTNPAAGNWVRLRQVSYGDSLLDPKETIKPEAGKQAVVPFRSVTGVTTPNFADFYTAGTTNEVPLAKTRVDGGGDLDFEVQTATEAYGLGCGLPVDGAPRSCWLVVVPRGVKEVNGQVAGGTGADAYLHDSLDSSPLSASNWANRIAIKLSFQLVGSACPLGVAERLTGGDEFMAEAMQRWQPKLCGNGGTVYGFTSLPDGVAREKLQSDKPDLQFLTDPLPPGEETRPVVYAPIALSGLSVAFMMERQSAGSAVVPPEIWQHDGEQVTALNLTPRLVAKLLTQSYKGSLPGRVDYLGNNPTFLTRDQDFLQVNHDIGAWAQQMSTVDALVSTVDYDQTAVLWSWINGDPDARAFLNGVPDPWGMIVNPNYQGMALPVSTFPKSDFHCDGTGVTESCAADTNPLAADMHDAARAASRGDTLGKEPSGLVNPIDQGKLLKARDRQPVGQRSLLAITDTATAARYGLPTARLRNASGAFVAPTEANLLAGVGAMKDSGVPEVEVSDPATKAADAYPLTNISWAATAPSALDVPAGADYAKFIRYAVGDGQNPGIDIGQLPPGYVPLPGDLRAQALRAADRIAADAGKPVPGPAAGGGLGSAVDGQFSPQDNGSASGDVPGGAPAGEPSGLAAPKAPALAGKPVQTKAQTPAAKVTTTPADPLGAVRWALVALLVLGGLGTGAGPVLLRWSGRMRG